MKLTPNHLNAAIACLFIVGSACFALGSVTAFANAVGGTADAATYFVGSLFFTSASFFQLVQAQTPAMTEFGPGEQTRRARVRLLAWRPRQQAWLAAVTQFPGTLCFNVSTMAALVNNLSVAAEDRYVWRPDLFGSVLFLVASWFGILAARHVTGSAARKDARRIAWLNMVGSILFMASAVASYVLPDDQVVDLRLSVGGTLGGAVCFLLGAALMFPAWRAALQPSTGVSVPQREER